MDLLKIKRRHWEIVPFLLESLIFHYQLVFRKPPILLGKAKLGVSDFFLPYLAFAECLVHSEVANSEGAITIWTGSHIFAHIIKASHTHPHQSLSAEAWKAPVHGLSFGCCFSCSNLQLYRLPSNTYFMLWLLSSREPKVQQSGFSSCSLWVGLDCGEVKVSVMWKVIKQFLSVYWVKKGSVACLDALWCWNLV